MEQENLCFLVESYKPPHLLNEFSKVYSKARFLVHLDAKSRFGLSLFSEKNIQVLPERISVVRGRISQIEVKLLLLRHGLKDERNQRFVLISGEDFPVKSPAEFLSYLENHLDSEFIDVSNGLGGSKRRFQKRLSVYYPRFLQGYSTVARLLRRIYVTLQGGERDWTLFKRKLPTLATKPCFGKAWFCLTRQAAEYLLEEAESASGKEFLRFLDHSTDPDECYFQTLMGNSPLANRCQPSLTYVKFERRQSHPVLLNEEVVEQLNDEPFFFARKFENSSIVGKNIATKLK